MWQGVKRSFGTWVTKILRKGSARFVGKMILSVLDVLLGTTSGRQMEDEYHETMKIIDLKYPGIVLSEQSYLNQNEEEKIEAFIKRISKAN